MTFKKKQKKQKRLKDYLRKLNCSESKLNYIKEFNLDQSVPDYLKDVISLDMFN